MGGHGGGWRTDPGAEEGECGDCGQCRVRESDGDQCDGEHDLCRGHWSGHVSGGQWWTHDHQETRGRVLRRLDIHWYHLLGCGLC